MTNTELIGAVLDFLDDDYYYFEYLEHSVASVPGETGLIQDALSSLENSLIPFIWGMFKSSKKIDRKIAKRSSAEKLFKPLTKTSIDKLQEESAKTRFMVLDEIISFYRYYHGENRLLRALDELSVSQEELTRVLDKIRADEANNKFYVTIIAEGKE